MIELLHLATGVAAGVAVAVGSAGGWLLLCLAVDAVRRRRARPAFTAPAARHVAGGRRVRTAV